MRYPLLIALIASPAVAQSCSWSLINHPPGPSPRMYSAGAFDPVRARTVIFGGYGSSFQTLSDAWEWDGQVWTELASGPPRYGPSMAYDAARNVIVMFGGFEDSSGLKDTWTFNGSEWTLVAVDGPIARWGGAMAYDAGRQRIVLFGGNMVNGAEVGATWEWDGQVWHRSPAPPVLGYRAFCAMAYDPGLQRVVLHGGSDYNFDPLGDTWAFDGSQWSLLAAVGPLVSSHGMAYARGRLVMQAGNARGYPTNGRTYEWNGGNWSTLPDVGPLNWGAAYAFDSDRHRLVRFGGSDYTTYSGATFERACGLTCYANCDGSGGFPVLAANDFQCFINRFAAGDPYANCDGSTMTPSLTAADFMCFISRYAAGCS